MYTPGKATVQHFKDSPQLCIEVPDWRRAESARPAYIATIYGPNPEEDAQRIATALNSHDKLLEALETLREWLPSFGPMDGTVWTLIDTAIAEAKGD